MRSGASESAPAQTKFTEPGVFNRRWETSKRGAALAPPPSSRRFGRGRRPNPPNHIRAGRDIIGHQQRTVGRDGEAGGPPAHGAFGSGIADEPGHEVFVLASRTAVDPPDSKHLVAGEYGPIPCPVARDEDVI